MHVTNCGHTVNPVFVRFALLLCWLIGATLALIPQSVGCSDAWRPLGAVLVLVAAGLFTAELRRPE